MVCFKSGDSDMKDKPDLNSFGIFYEQDMQALAHCWWRCLTSDGNYAEEW